jgi:hypothetical protein
MVEHIDKWKTCPYISADMADTNPLIALIGRTAARPVLSVAVAFTTATVSQEETWLKLPKKNSTIYLPLQTQS